MAPPPPTLSDNPVAIPAVEDHRRRRDRAAWKTVRALLSVRVVNIAVRLVTIPLSLQLLGTERYGLWLTVGSLLMWLGLYDLGLSSGLVNAVGDAYGRGDTRAMRGYVSTAFYGLSAVSLAMIAAVLCAAAWPGLPRLLGVAPGSPLASDARALVLFCGAVFAVTFTVNSANYIASALQEGYLAGYSQVVGTTLSCAVLVLISFVGASAVGFAAVMAVPGLLATIGLAVYIFFVRHPELRPSLRLCSRANFRTIYGFGTPIFLSQMADLGIVYATNLMIANRLGPALVPLYTVPATAFAAATSFCNSIATSHMPAYVEAKARQDWVWIRRAAFRTLFACIGIIAAAGLVMTLAGNWIVTLWTKGRVNPPGSLLLAISVFYVFVVWANTTGPLLIGLGRAKVKAWLNGAVALVYVVACWLLLPHLGVIAIPLAGILGYLVDFAVSLPYALRFIAAQPARAGAASSPPDRGPLSAVVQSGGRE